MSDLGTFESAEALARRFHEVYEALAPAFNYETRKASAVPWEQVPEHNKRLMVAVADVLLDDLAASSAVSAPENKEGT